MPDFHSLNQDELQDEPERISLGVINIDFAYADFKTIYYVTQTFDRI